MGETWLLSIVPSVTQVVTISFTNVLQNFYFVFFKSAESTSDEGFLDPEIKLRSDRRRISLMSLLDENQSVISNIAEKRRKRSEFRQQQTLSVESESSRSDTSDGLKLFLIREDVSTEQQQQDQQNHQQQNHQQQQQNVDITPTASTGAVPKHRASIVLPSIVVPPSSGPQRGRLGKARSVSPSSSAAKERLQVNNQQFF
jgi:hypothetical protein